MSTAASREKPAIVERPSFTVVGMEYDDKLGSIMQFWQQYLPREHEITQRVQQDVSYGLCIAGAGEEMRYVAGTEVNPGAPVPPGMVTVQVPAQRYAVFTYTGTADGIDGMLSHIYQHGLADKHLQKKPGIDFECYDDRFIGPTDPASEMDLYISIA